MKLVCRSQDVECSRLLNSTCSYCFRIVAYLRNKLFLCSLHLSIIRAKCLRSWTPLPGTGNSTPGVPCMKYLPCHLSLQAPAHPSYFNREGSSVSRLLSFSYSLNLRERYKECTASFTFYFLWPLDCLFFILFSCYYVTHSLFHRRWCALLTIYFSELYLHQSVFVSTFSTKMTNPPINT